MKPMDLWDVLGDLPEEDVAWMLNYEPPHRRTAFLVSKPFRAGLSAAACLIVTVGLSVGIWSRHQRIDTRPPQETQTTTVMQTETRSETTAQVMTETQTTRNQTETSLTTMRSTTAGSVYDFAETSVSQTILSTTACLTSFDQNPVISTAIITEVTRASTSLQPPISPSHILVRKDTQTPETRLSESASTSEQVQATMLPASDVTPTIITSAEASTGIAVCDTGTTYITTVLPQESTSETSETSASEVRPDLQQFPGFSVLWMHLSDDWRKDMIQISRLQLVEKSPYLVADGIFIKYTVMSDYIQFVREQQADSMPGASTHDNSRLTTYTAAVTESGQTFEVEQYMRSIRFHVQCDSNTNYTAGFLDNNPCVWLTQGEQCALYWDDGSYTFCIRGNVSDQEVLEEIAVCMRQKTGEEMPEI